jgi:phenylacetate-coenzyme A ligase PaaK-like adenylate-forming protein
MANLTHNALPADTEALVSELLAFIARTAVTDDDFNTLALKVFAHQFGNNLPFQRFCQGRGKTPRLVKRWQDIPAVPINAFKDLTLSCVPPENCARTFMTSGTTRGDVKGRHFHPTMAVYDASMRRNFAQHVMQGDTRLRMGILFPTEALMPNSSLAHYLALAIEHFGTPASAYYIDESGLCTDTLCDALQQTQDAGEPWMLLGASYSFVHLMDALHARGHVFQLPSGSRLLDTGGFKGQSREVPMDTFYDQLSATLGISRDQCFNMYGMTELSTQFYDAGNRTVPSVKRGPHWIRSRLVDPLTGQDVPFGERGILAHTDLANFNSVVTILTEDVGIATHDGFVLLGRAEGTQAKGCSMAVDDFLKAARP